MTKNKSNKGWFYKRGNFYKEPTPESKIIIVGKDYKLEITDFTKIKFDPKVREIKASPSTAPHVQKMVEEFEKYQLIKRIKNRRLKMPANNKTLKELEGWADK